MRFCGLGNTCLAEQRLNEAVSAFAQAIANDPFGIHVSPQSFFGRASAYQSLGKLPEAIADYSEAIRVSPHFREAYLKRGTAWLQLARQHRQEGNVHQAEPALHQAEADLQAFASMVDTLEMSAAAKFLAVETERGYLCYALGHPEDAAQSLAVINGLRQLSETPENQQPADATGLRRELSGIAGDLMRLLVKLCDIPGDARSLATDDREQARECLGRAITLDPGRAKAARSDFQWFESGAS